MIVGFVIVPITIHYLSASKYGVWITLTSLISWFSFFDIGLGNGLRNKFAISIARGNILGAKQYVSSAYFLISIIAIGVTILFLFFQNWINWNSILNIAPSEILPEELFLLALITVISFNGNLVLNLIVVILTADQKPSIAAFLDLIGKSLSLFFIYVLTSYSSGSLVLFGVIYSFLTPTVLLCASIFFFRGKYAPIKPEYKYVKKEIGKELASLGWQFFVLQIAVILLYQTNNIIFGQLFGPTQVTAYNIVFKYFSILMMGFGIIMTPLWSVFTEAWTKYDLNWIKSAMKRMLQLWFVFFIVALIMLAFSERVYSLWVGEQKGVTFILSLLIGLWVMLNIWNGIFSQFLNGVGKIRLQMIVGIFVAILNVPLAITLGKEYGSEGVILSNVILSAAQVCIFPIQYYKLINGKASGFWNA